MPTLKRQLCRVTIVFLGLICLSWTLALAAEDWAIPLPTDAAIHTGRLSNGVTYWIRSHATPPGKISLWIDKTDAHNSCSFRSAFGFDMHHAIASTYH